MLRHPVAAPSECATASRPARCRLLAASCITSVRRDCVARACGCNCTDTPGRSAASWRLGERSAASSTAHLRGAVCLIRVNLCLGRGTVSICRAWRRLAARLRARLPRHARVAERHLRCAIRGGARPHAAFFFKRGGAVQRGRQRNRPQREREATADHARAHRGRGAVHAAALAQRCEHDGHEQHGERAHRQVHPERQVSRAARPVHA
mmetsp:Transcript_8510/g.21982  ORF Transcript_8510/g.21982 Transcript_8510/m.21982 type:complete len:208 (-) Transcript_8510:264-887(-)